jgi:hypothetical protein
MSNRTRIRKTDRATKFDANSYEAPAIVGGGRAPQVEEILLFSYQADEESKVEEFWVPKETSRAQSMRILEIYTSKGEVAATIEMLKGLVGDRGWAILTDEDLIDKDSYDAIVDAAFKITLGDQGKAGGRS